MINIALLFPRTVLRIKVVNKFKPFFDAFFGPYKDKFSFWTGLQLFARALFYGLTFQLTQDLGTTSGIILLLTLLFLQGILQPFKSYFKNVQESLILLNLVTVYVTTALNSDRNRSKNLIFAVKLLIYAQLTYFIVYIICHGVITVCGKTVRAICKKIFYIFMKNHKPAKDLQNSYSCEIPMVTYNYQQFQDPLIGLDN